MALTKIKTGGIADNAITNAKMADNAIDSADFVDGSIDNAHLADDAVNSDEIAAGAIDLAHMSVNSIDSDQYVDGSIDNVHLAGSIAVSKTLLAGGTGLTLSTNTLAVDAAQTQITSVGTITTGVWNAGAVTSSGSIKGSATGAGRILNETASATNPTLNPRNDESSTGIGGVGSSLYIISNGTTNSTYSGTTATFAGNLGVGQATPQTDNSTARFLHIGDSGDATSGLVLEDNEAQWEIQNNGHLRIKKGSTDVLEFNMSTYKATFTGDLQISDDLHFNSVSAWLIASGSGGTLRVQNFDELEVDGVLDINGTGENTFAGRVEITNSADATALRIDQSDNDGYGINVDCSHGTYVGRGIGMTFARARSDAYYILEAHDSGGTMFSVKGDGTLYADSSATLSKDVNVGEHLTVGHSGSVGDAQIQLWDDRNVETTMPMVSELIMMHIDIGTSYVDVLEVEAGYVYTNGYLEIVINGEHGGGTDARYYGTVRFAFNPSGCAFTDVGTLDETPDDMCVCYYQSSAKFRVKVKTDQSSTNIGMYFKLYGMGADASGNSYNGAVMTKLV